ncbi:phosphoserine phosphatase (serB) [Archaeoglobus fulgidus DSM 4304]|uniref:Phosphoserine phosphatase n=3 Tax=Archaeoglobus fulgidus TaxID=2234 RepID=SERB_ARCFU|nr:RecName: Full=Phosphoserine phosphatase; Short=PSP; Short=PSPase; AltName: Full=O-phosphoserine phosphohydrolase [Archaeoglobus fulgidus DSM 4304]AAB89113.1 phosphoserine phosphatase (serB) [Archaeoglobus fulgidus DSM 4304]
MFVMFIVAEVDDEVCVKREVERAAGEVGVHVSLTPFQRREKAEKNLYVVTILGKDRVGIVRDITRAFLDFGINIERTSLTAREELISIEFLVDLGQRDAAEVRKRLRREAERLGLDIVMQPYSTFNREKRLIVFDMDSTLVEAEIIDELAKEAGVGDEVSKLTERAMRGEIGFKEALEERVRLLKGLPVEVLERIYSRIKLTEGAKELVRSLKEAGYKVAVVSGGFSYFTDRLKEELGLDYAFGNELEIENGRLTGRIKGRIIDASEKARIVEEIARKEGISPENVVAVGDGANDRLMIERAGLGIAFNAKEVLKDVADGSISKENLVGLASVLKLPAEFRKKV